MVDTLYKTGAFASTMMLGLCLLLTTAEFLLPGELKLGFGKDARTGIELEVRNSRIYLGSHRWVQLSAEDTWQYNSDVLGGRDHGWLAFESMFRTKTEFDLYLFGVTTYAWPIYVRHVKVHVSLWLLATVFASYYWFCRLRLRSCNVAGLADHVRIDSGP